MRAESISPDLLVEYVADAIAALPLPGDQRVAIAVDGAPPTRGGEFADRVAVAVRLRGRAAVHVAAGDYLRPASLRFELGRQDPDLFYEDWLDRDAIEREVLKPISPGGSGRVLPRLWDARADRAYRAQYESLGPGGVVLLDGPFLLAAGLPFDLSVHLSMSAAALIRRTVSEDAWTLPAYARYESEWDPVCTADIAVRCDDPLHPALVIRDSG